MALKDWARSASGNATVAGINWAEGQAPSTVNNSAREVMAQIREEYQPDEWGWVEFSGSASVATQTSVKVTGDQTAQFVANRRLRLTGGTTTRYATITSASFTTETTVTMAVDSGSLSASHSIVALSAVMQESVPRGQVARLDTSQTFAQAQVFGESVSFSASAHFRTAVDFSATVSVGRIINLAGATIYGDSASASGTLASTAGVNTSDPATSWDLSGNTDALRLPSGTEAQRPGTPVVGDMRHNSSLSAIEAYANSLWWLVPTKLLHVRDEKTDGTQGGTATSGAWRTRDLNTTLTNEILGASLASNQISLPAGTYYIEARAPAFRTNGHKARLQNVTDTTTILLGSNALSSGGADNQSDSWVVGRFTLAAAKTLELQHQVESTQSSAGFGDNDGFAGVVEVYSDVRIWKLAG